MARSFPLTLNDPEVREAGAVSPSQGQERLVNEACKRRLRVPNLAAEDAGAEECHEPRRASTRLALLSGSEIIAALWAAVYAYISTRPKSEIPADQVPDVAP